MSSARTPLLVTAAIVLAFTAAIVPFKDTQLDMSMSFMPGLVAAVTVLDLMTIYLLLGDFRDRGELRTLVTAAAYTWALTLMLGFGLAFPGALFVDPPFAFSPSTAPYLYLGWQCGFPVLLALAWGPWPARFVRKAPPGLRAPLAVAGTLATCLAGAGAVALVGVFDERLPVLIDGLDTTRMGTLSARLIVPLMLFALVGTVRGTWRRTGPERWTSVAVLACVCDLHLTYSSGSRFTVGWYAGRSLTIVATGVVLFAMLATFRRLKVNAERDAFLDPLTQLLNRRGAFAGLDVMVDRARRAGTPVGVAVLDLDWFKTVNDKEGHEAGDRVLVEVGRVLSTCSRGDDVAARVGGEEFLVILNDTDPAQAMAAAERLRCLIADVSVPGVETPISASIGVTVLQSQDVDPAAVLRRADAALYDAKRGGRDRVEGRFLEELTLT